MTENSVIPVFRPWCDQREIEAVAEVIKSGWTTLGPKTAQFEEEFEEKYCKMPVVGLNSATAALDMALKLIGVNRGDEVIVPTITFVSTAHVVKYNLAEPIFCDVDFTTLNMDIEDACSKITKRTKAIIPVHYSGRPVDILTLKYAVQEKCRKIGRDPLQISTVEDCAHASGAYYKGKSLPIGNMGCFSFHAVKNLSMGEGGALVTFDKEMIERAKRLRWLGIDKSTWNRIGIDKSYWWEYSVDEIGLKSHMDDIHAAIGLVQLDKLQEANRLRKERVEWYRELLDDLLMRIMMPPNDTLDSQSSWHLLCVKADRRDSLAIFLKENGITTGVHYKPIHLYNVYGNKPSLPISEGVFPSLLTLPLYPGLTREQVSFICEKIHQFYKEEIR